jgi:hypothetical protein
MDEWPVLLSPCARRYLIISIFFASWLYNFDEIDSTGHLTFALFMRGITSRAGATD